MMTEVEVIANQRLRFSISTIRELAAAIVANLPAQPELLKRIKNGSGAPFIFCHDDHAASLQLAEMLTCERPVYLLHLFPNPKLSIEEMAQAYLPDVLALQPTGLVALGGHCKGGFFAWEIAYQLTRMGRDVEVVVLAESISTNARPVFRATAKLIGFVAAVTPQVFSDKLKTDGMRTVWRLVKRMWTVCCRMKFSISGSSGPYSRAMANYIPPKIPSPVLCVICKQSSSLGKSVMPWTRLAPKVRCDRVAGTHMSCITDGGLANALDNYFRREKSDLASRESPYGTNTGTVTGSMAGLAT